MRSTVPDGTFLSSQIWLVLLFALLDRWGHDIQKHIQSPWVLNVCKQRTCILSEAKRTDNTNHLHCPPLWEMAPIVVVCKPYIKFILNGFRAIKTLIHCTKIKRMILGRICHHDEGSWWFRNPSKTIFGTKLLELKKKQEKIILSSVTLIFMKLYRLRSIQ